MEKYHYQGEQITIGFEFIEEIDCNSYILDGCGISEKVNGTMKCSRWRIKIDVPNASFKFDEVLVAHRKTNKNNTFYYDKHMKLDRIVDAINRSLVSHKKLFESSFSKIAVSNESEYEDLQKTKMDDFLTIKLN